MTKKVYIIWQDLHDGPEFVQAFRDEDEAKAEAKRLNAIDRAGAGTCSLNLKWFWEVDHYWVEAHTLK